jgi:hypothetical protein
MVASLLASLGCSSTTTVSRSDWPQVADGVLRGNARPDVAVEFAGAGTAQTAGTSWQGRLLAVDGSALILGDRPGSAYRIPFDGTTSLRFTDRKRGILDGLWIGAIPGALSGVLLGSAAAGFCSSGGFAGGPNPNCNTAGIVAGTTLFGAALGAIIGASVGVLVGHRTTYKLAVHDDSPPPELPDRLSEGARCRCEDRCGR